jgi:hypothetical protein
MNECDNEKGATQTIVFSLGFHLCNKMYVHPNSNTCFMWKCITYDNDYKLKALINLCEVFYEKTINNN